MPMQQAGRWAGEQIGIGRDPANTWREGGTSGPRLHGEGVAPFIRRRPTGFPHPTRAHTESSSKVSSAVVAKKMQSRPSPLA